MLLQRLNEYQSREPTVPDEEADQPPEYTFRAVPWIIHLDDQGNSLGFVRTSGGRPRNDPGKRIAAPLLRRSGTNVKPQVLADTAEFVLGIGDDPSRSARRHAEFVVLVEACAETTHDIHVHSVAKFLQGLPHATLQPPPDLKPGDWVTFQIGEVRLVDIHSVQSFWAQVAPKLGEKGLPQLTRELVLSWVGQASNDKIGQCLVCREAKPIARVHPVPIRLPRAVSDRGLSIVTANKEAFWSYGLEQSFLAPTCRECAVAYARALNRLARDETSHIILGGAAFIFWTREEVHFNFFSYMSDPKPEEVRSLLDSVRTGKRAPEVDDTEFYATALSGNGGRAVVRDWIDTTVGEAKGHLAAWFQRQSIVGDWGEESQPLPVVGYFHRESSRWVDGLAESLVPAIRGRRDPNDVGPAVARALWRTGLTGAPLPPGLLYQAVRRNRAEQTVTRPRAALIKLVLLSNQLNSKEDDMVQLDPQYPSPAYHCGRLLAVLEQVQRQALGKATIVDRFFGTASSAPASVFGRLLRGSQPHLAKLERDNPGAFLALQRRLEEVQGCLRGFPRILTLEEQGLFALGYYHQRAFDRAQAREAADRRRAGNTEDTMENTKREEN